MSKPMVIQTRYRDIPFEEAVKCQPISATEPDAQSVWAKLRGGAVQIEVPANAPRGLCVCGGPFFWIYPDTRNKEGYRFMACPHIADIGD